MAQYPIKINASQPIVNTDGTPSQQFQLMLNQLANNVSIIATGNPEGAIEAPQYSVYVDDTVPATPVTYRKMLPDIAGNKKMGWVIV